MSSTLPPPPPPPGGGPPPPLSKTVLLQNLPDFLCDKGRLHTWLGAVTGVRQIHIIKKHDDKPKSSLVTTIHPDGAVKLVVSIRYVRQQLLNDDDNNNNNNNNSGGESGSEDTKQDAAKKILAGHWVPTQPHVPLPPPALDPVLAETLGKRMWSTYQRLSSGQALDPQQQQDQQGSSNENEAPTSSFTNANKNNNMDEGVDDTEDPLTTPAVLEAVRQFRASLEEKQGSKAVRRKELVKSSLDRILPRVREEMERAPPPASPQMMGGGGGHPPPAAPGNLPPPPMPTGLPPPPMPTGGPPPPPPGNLPPPPMPTGGPPPPLPAGGLPPPPSHDEAPPAKRARTAASSIPLDVSQPFPAFAADQTAAVQAFIKERMQHYLGEADDALVQFTMDNIQKPTVPMQDYMADLQEVLEEDATRLMQELLDHVQSLQ